ncbi:MAG: hypothetical protein R3200_01200 [Xanthomonadales bacterium]|nr:hypothetical protein [Xanthomonadales bacterium]
MSRINGLSIILGVLALFLSASAQADRHQQLEILEAIYGTANQVCQATRDVQYACDGRTYCDVEANNRLCGDPARNSRKRLIISYSCGDGIRTVQVWEGEVASAYCMDTRHQAGGRPPIPGFERCRNRRDCQPRGSDRNRIWIGEAVYGARDRFCDATDLFVRYCDGQARCSITVDNDLCGDPIRNVKKRAEVDYYCNGRRLQVQVPEDRTAVLSCP